MLRVFCLLLAIPAVVAVDVKRRRDAASIRAVSLSDYTYSDFVADFSRDIPQGSPEWSVRDGLFRASLAKVKELRAIPNMNWVPGISRFMDYHAHEYNQLLGYKGRRGHAGGGGGGGGSMRKQSVGDGHGGGGGPFESLGFAPVPPAAPIAMSQGSADAAQDAAAAEVATGGADGAQGAAPVSFYAIGMNSSAGSVHDQGNCGSCWADAAMTALEGAVNRDAALADEVRRRLGLARYEEFYASRDHVIACTRNPRHCGGRGGCDGATSELAFRLAWREGVPLLAHSEPYRVSASGVVGVCDEPGQAPERRLRGLGFTAPWLRAGGYTVLPVNGPRLVRTLITQSAPISVGVDASSWRYYSHGVYGDTDINGQGEFTVNHMVALVGYDLSKNPVSYYLLKNSWGKNWGESGYMRLEMKPYEHEHCGWDNEAHMGVACDDDSDKAWVCGTCGILFDASFPTGVYVE